MKITLGNFRKWRIKKCLAFLFCMAVSVIAIVLINKTKLNTGILFSGLIFYDIIISLPFFKNNNYEAYISDQRNIINVKTDKIEFFIPKADIKDVLLKEVNYGGKWLDVIGYRLIITADRKYIFDSVFLNKEKDMDKIKEEMGQLFTLFKSSI